LSATADTPVLIVTGPPGVGKTTTAAILADRSPQAVHLEADHFFRFIRTGYVEPWKPESQEQNEAVMRIVAAAAAGYADAGYFTIVDGIVIPAWFLQPLRDALGEAGQTVAYAVLRAPLEVCTARAQTREGPFLAEPDVIRELWESFADLGELEGNAVEVGEFGPEQAADLLAGRLEEGGLSL
jgi:tRNA uridine 5-carbamoylmethylation protein Kti12